MGEAKQGWLDGEARMDAAGDYVARWERRIKADQERRHRRAREALVAARKCARLLYEKYGVHRVYLVGSLLEPEAFHDRSDIDLVVEGLPPRRYFRALAELWRELPAGLELDLIPFEDADTKLRKRVVEEGATLHG